MTFFFFTARPWDSGFKPQGQRVCVVAGGTSPPAVLEGEIGRSW